MRAQEDGSAGKSMKQNTSGYLLALLAVVIWSGNFVVARAVADMIPGGRLSPLLNDIGTAMSMLLGLVGCCGIMLFFSFMAAIKVVAA